jgi:predicted ATP-grasp superfamily ATP-dependent carboligase
VLASLERVGRRLARRFGTRVPLACGNDDFPALSPMPTASSLGEHYRLPFVDSAWARRCWTSRSSPSSPGRYAFPVPRILSWTGEDADPLDGFDGPVIVKPKVKFRWEDSPLLASLFGGEAKAAIIRERARGEGSHPALRQHHADPLSSSTFPATIGSCAASTAYCDDGSRLLAGYTGRKVRTFPPLVGDSSCIELTHEPELVRLGSEVAGRLGLRGIFNMDFKQDPRDGRFLSPRGQRALQTSGSTLGAKNGINRARVMYDWHLRRAVPEHSSHGTRVRWVDMKLDYRAFRSLAKRGEIGWARWLASLAPPTVHSLFSWRDPYPWFVDDGPETRAPVAI